MIQFINNIIDYINSNIHGLAAIFSILFVIFVLLNDRYDLTNEKCECGFKIQIIMKAQHIELDQKKIKKNQ
jgi:hypothetical protein